MWNQVVGQAKMGDALQQLLVHDHVGAGEQHFGEMRQVRWYRVVADLGAARPQVDGLSPQPRIRRQKPLVDDRQQVAERVRGRGFSQRCQQGYANFGILLLISAVGGEHRQDRL